MRVLLLLALFATPTGQGGRTYVDDQEMRLVIPNSCITRIDTDKVYLVGPDLKHMTAYGLMVHYKENCEYWEAVPKATPASANDGVLGPFSRCSQNFTGDNQPIKSASLSQSGEADTFTNPEDPFGIGEE